MSEAKPGKREQRNKAAKRRQRIARDLRTVHDPQILALGYLGDLRFGVFALDHGEYGIVDPDLAFQAGKLELGGRQVLQGFLFSGDGLV